MWPPRIACRGPYEAYGAVRLEGKRRALCLRAQQLPSLHIASMFPCASTLIAMWICSQQEHAIPFKVKYHCAADRETGKIVAVDIELFSNAGFSTDLSESVMDRALFHCVNAYKVPNVRVQGNLAMTNTVTNTAFRGFGGPQGMLVCETFVEHIAKEIGMDVSEVRRRNMYKEGDLTHYGQVSLRVNFSFGSQLSIKLTHTQM